jgi:hypothetical protein
MALPVVGVGLDDVPSLYAACPFANASIGMAHYTLGGNPDGGSGGGGTAAGLSLGREGTRVSAASAPVRRPLRPLWRPY